MDPINQNSSATPPTVPPTTQGGSPDPGTMFGQAIMQMLQKYQNINQTPFLNAQLSAQSQAASGVAYTDPNLIGASPSQQAQSQNANAAGPAQAAQNYANAGQTFQGQLQSFNQLLNQANTLGQNLIQINPGPDFLTGIGQAISDGAALSIIPDQSKPAVYKYLASHPEIMQSWAEHQKVQTVPYTYTDAMGNILHGTLIKDPQTGMFQTVQQNNMKIGETGTNTKGQPVTISQGGGTQSTTKSKPQNIGPISGGVQYANEMGWDSSATTSGIPSLKQAESKAKGSPLPNSTMEQAAYDLAFGKVPPPTSSIPRSQKTAMYQNMITQRAEQLNPNFNLANAVGQYKYATDTSTKTKVQAINAVLPNMDTLVSLSDAFKRSDYPTINSGLRALGWLSGDQTVSSLNEAASIIGDEMGVALGGGTMSDMKLTLGLKITDPILSAKNYATNINMVKNFLNNRLQSIGQQAGPYAQGELGIIPQSSSRGSSYKGFTLPN